MPMNPGWLLPWSPPYKHNMMNAAVLKSQSHGLSGDTIYMFYSHILYSKLQGSYRSLITQMEPKHHESPCSRQAWDSTQGLYRDSLRAPRSCPGHRVWK